MEKGVVTEIRTDQRCDVQDSIWSRFLHFKCCLISAVPVQMLRKSLDKRSFPCLGSLGTHQFSLTYHLQMELSNILEEKLGKYTVLSKYCISFFQRLAERSHGLKFEWGLREYVQPGAVKLVL